MSGANLRYPDKGRSAWPKDGTGGTLNAAGDGPGPYYRLATNPQMLPVGLKGWQADQNGTEISINEYAVWCAVLGLQTELRERGFFGANRKPLKVDGVFAKHTDFAVRTFQSEMKLPAEGLYGPRTAKAMWLPMAEEAAKTAASTVDHADAATLISRLVVGTINHESSWDPGAVGSNPMDLGLGQLNVPSHAKLSAYGCLFPQSALPYMAKHVILENLIWAEWETDAAVAAYNLGKGGVSAWRRAGSPQFWPKKSKNDIHKYIQSVLNP